MSKLFSITCSFLILVSSFNMSLEDLSKLRVLFEHASFHAENYGCSFSEFIEENYASNDVYHGVDHEEHDELPFKHHHKSCHHIATSFTFEPHYFNFSNLLFVEIPLNYLYKESYSLFEKPSVFQPPQV